MSLIKLNNRAVKDIDAVGSIGTGELKFISKQTASSSASISFTSGIDSTYKEYVFYFVDLHPATDGVKFQFNLSTDGGSTYAVTKTTTFFRARHREDDAVTSLDYKTANDLAQSTSDQILNDGLGNDNDQALSGSLTLFNPSSDTFVKHFISDINEIQDNDMSLRGFVAGYGNTSTPINSAIFRMSSGNIDSGEIILFGIN